MVVAKEIRLHTLSLAFRLSSTLSTTLFIYPLIMSLATSGGGAAGGGGGLMLAHDAGGGGMANMHAPPPPPTAGGTASGQATFSIPQIEVCDKTQKVTL
jgi:hypothetical protein